MDNNTKQETPEEIKGYYKLVSDAYKQKYKVRTWILKTILCHMLDRTQEEPTIYLLMDMIREYRTMSKKVLN